MLISSIKTGKWEFFRDMIISSTTGQWEFFRDLFVQQGDQIQLFADFCFHRIEESCIPYPSMEYGISKSPLSKKISFFPFSARKMDWIKQGNGVLYGNQNNFSLYHRTFSWLKYPRGWKDVSRHACQLFPWRVESSFDPSADQKNSSWCGN